MHEDVKDCLEDNNFIGYSKDHIQCAECGRIFKLVNVI